MWLLVAVGGKNLWRNTGRRWRNVALLVYDRRYVGDGGGRRRTAPARGATAATTLRVGARRPCGPVPADLGDGAGLGVGACRP